MNTIVKLERVNCILESSEIGGAYRRRRVRERSSDELAFFYTFIPDGDMSRITHKSVFIEGLDSGDDLSRSDILFQGNVNESLQVIMASLEIDGIGSNENLVEKAFEFWMRVGNNFENLVNFYTDDDRSGEDIASTILPSIFSGGLDWYANGPGLHDTTMMDNYLFNLDELSGSTLPSPAGNRQMLNRNIYRSVRYNNLESRDGFSDERTFLSGESKSVYRIGHSYMEELLV